LLGADASKARLMALNASGALAQFSVLHFATHGYVDNERSALVLSSPTRSDQTYLFDEELATLSLSSDLTILSACDTGLGREVSGEGVVGLPYALFMAGNANTLMSLWAVDDDGTAQFIPAFLERVKTQGNMVQALRQTKLAFARGDFGTRLRDPRIWAPFVLYGASAK
jgi:CHAT domain-containing protein